MPDNQEERKSVAGIVTPDATKDDEWRREVAGVFTFTDSGGGEATQTTSCIGLRLGLGI